MNKKIAVIGLGYVGLPLAAAFSEKYTVLAYDNDSNRVGELNNGWDQIEQLAKADLIELQGRLTFSDDPESLSFLPNSVISSALRSFVIDIKTSYGFIGLKHGQGIQPLL